jgi:hypothetical protein
MIRILSLSACLVSLVVWGAAAQQLVPKPGFTEKRERVVCGRMGCEPKTFMHDRAAEGCRREVSSACPVPSRLSAADSSKHRLEAARLALPLRPLAGLAQVQEPERASGPPRGGGRLG